MSLVKTVLLDFSASGRCEFQSIASGRYSVKFPVAVPDYLHGEILLGRVARPFAEPPFTDAFVEARLYRTAHNC